MSIYKGPCRDCGAMNNDMVGGCRPPGGWICVVCYERIYQRPVYIGYVVKIHNKDREAREAAHSLCTLARSKSK